MKDGYRYRFVIFVGNSLCMKEVLYQKLSSTLSEKIKNGTLKTGEKMPSLRVLHKEYGVSINTAIQAYLTLEAKGLIESRPQSGYYVRYKPFHLSVPSISKPSIFESSECVQDLIAKVYANISSDDVTRFSLGVPSNELLPVAKLNKEMAHAMRTLKGGGTEYESIQGNRKLRRDVARMTYTWGGKFSEDDVVTTAGAMNALSFALLALTKRGDTIAVESPVYFGILQLAKSLGLKVVELPTHPVTGIEIDALKKVVKKIKLCLLVSNFNNPIGSLMPDEHKKEVVRLLTYHNIPLIEDDLYGDVYFGKNRPKPCKLYDEAGNVLWIGSVSKTLAPGYRVGWIVPGKFKSQIIHQKLIHSVSSTTLTQEAIAQFFETGRYEHHLRKLRSELHSSSLHFTRAIAEYFPEGTKVSQPQGGFMLWLELDKKIDVADVYDIAIAQKISIAPGRMFTLQPQFNNCMRLSYGFKWNAVIEDKLKRLGRILKGMM